LEFLNCLAFIEIRILQIIYKRNLVKINLVRHKNNLKKFCLRVVEGIIIMRPGIEGGRVFLLFDTVIFLWDFQCHKGFKGSDSAS
jgi:hypothetical protein